MSHTNTTTYLESVTAQAKIDIAKLVNCLILDAVGSDASDIHIEPWESTLVVRIRLLGVLTELIHLPLDFMDNPQFAKANVEAIVESGRVAAAGAQTLGQEAVARTREGLEQAATQVKSLTDAQSPTEFFQLQGEFARVQFDRIVADSSRFAESLVKLAGEAMQPLSTRAALNAEKLSELSA